MQPRLRFLESAEGKAGARSRGGERQPTVTGAALCIALKIVPVLKSAAERGEARAAHGCWRGLPGLRQGWSTRSLAGA